MLVKIVRFINVTVNVTVIRTNILQNLSIKKSKALLVESNGPGKKRRFAARPLYLLRPLYKGWTPRRRQVVRERTLNYNRTLCNVCSVVDLMNPQ